MLGINSLVDRDSSNAAFKVIYRSPIRLLVNLELGEKRGQMDAILYQKMVGRYSIGSEDLKGIIRKDEDPSG